MSSVPVRTPAEVLEALRKLILENQDSRSLAIYVFGWACGVCKAAGITLDELAGFIRKYQNEDTRRAMIECCVACGKPAHPGLGCGELERMAAAGFPAAQRQVLENAKIIGNGDFSIGSKVWPGTSKLLEEMGELQQVLGKLIAVSGSTEHWDGDLRPRLIEEFADVVAALRFFEIQNLTSAELSARVRRSEDKFELFRKWHAENTRPPEGYNHMEKR